MITAVVSHATASNLSVAWLFGFVGLILGFIGGRAYATKMTLRHLGKANRLARERDIKSIRRI